MRERAAAIRSGRATELLSALDELIDGRWRTIRQLVFASYGRTCWHCGGPAVDVDHLLPIADGGTDSLANLRPACTRCNRGRR